MFCCMDISTILHNDVFIEAGDEAPEFFLYCLRWNKLQNKSTTMTTVATIQFANVIKDSHNLFRRLVRFASD